MRRFWRVYLLGLLLLGTAGALAGAKIQSGATADELTIDPTSKAARVTPYDSGGKDATATRTWKTFSAVNFTAATTEALVTLSPATDWVNGTTGTSFAVAAGKRLVILGIACATKNAAAAQQGVITRLRVSASGAVTVSSPLLVVCGAGTAAAVANVVGGLGFPVSAAWPTQIELSGTMQLGISQIGTATAGNDVVMWGFEY